MNSCLGMKIALYEKQFSVDVKAGFHTVLLLFQKTPTPFKTRKYIALILSVVFKPPTISKSLIINDY